MHVPIKPTVRESPAPSPASGQALSSTGISKPNLVVLPNVLLPGATYTFKLEASYEGRTASATCEIVINRAPVSLKSVLPTSLLSTPVAISFLPYTSRSSPPRGSLAAP